MAVVTGTIGSRSQLVIKERSVQMYMWRLYRDHRAGKREAIWNLIEVMTQGMVTRQQIPCIDSNVP